MGVEDPRHEEVAAAEDVARDLLSCGRPSTLGDLHLALDLGHVAVLAALLVGVRAVPPLEVGHLLGQLADHLALVVEGVGEQGVAGGAELGALDVRRLRRAEARGRAASASGGPASTSNGP